MGRLQDQPLDANFGELKAPTTGHGIGSRLLKSTRRVWNLIFSELPEALPGAIEMQELELLAVPSPSKCTAAQISRDVSTVLNPEPSILFPYPSEWLERNFELRTTIGRGGFGLIFGALHRQSDQEVVLKVPRPQMWISEENRKMTLMHFFAEIEAHNRLYQASHDQFDPTISEYGTEWILLDSESEHWLPILVLPHFSPESFQDSLSQVPSVKNCTFPLSLSCMLNGPIRDVCLQLETAHERGVVHLDLKPANIVCSKPPAPASSTEQSPTWRIVDWGLAAFTDSGTRNGPFYRPLNLGGARIDLSNPSPDHGKFIRLGTRAYMAPELRTWEYPIGIGADIYSLGVLLHRTIFRKLPRPGDWPCSPGEKIAEILSPLIQQCLETDPAARPKSVGQILERIDAALATD